MAETFTADLDALRALAEKQKRSAATLREIDVLVALRQPQWALAGSDVAVQCLRAGPMADTAISAVAARVDALARANLTAATTIGMADDEYASNIRSVLDLL